MNRNCPAQVGGIAIDADGVVTTIAPTEHPRTAERRMRTFAEERLSAELRAVAPLRKVSLKQLELRVKEALATGQPLPDELKYVYGLQRIEYIFVDPEALDVLIAGPAEAFAPNIEGRVVGLTTGRPTLRLDDLVVALRANFARNDMISVSIDPETDRLKELQEYMAQNQISPSREESVRRFQTMAEILGMQQITLGGVPESSHFAMTLVEADYRMKRIAIGVEKSPVSRIRSQLAHTKPGGNTLQRWWFTPLYEPIETDDAELTYRLAGPRCQLLAQEEWTDASGNRTASAFTRASTQKFAEEFSKHFEDLAKEAPVFAVLQNEFDLAVMAALFRVHRIPQRVDWKMDFFLTSKEIPIETYPVARSVPSGATARASSRFTVGIVGGVSLDAFSVVKQELSRARSADLEATRLKSTSNPTKTPGWWD